jgi:hypothetical protein
VGVAYIRTVNGQPGDRGADRALQPARAARDRALRIGAHAGDVEVLTDEGGRVPWARLLQGTPVGPQITVGLLTDVHGFPLTVHAFEGKNGDLTSTPRTMLWQRREAMYSTAIRATQSGV